MVECGIQASPLMSKSTTVLPCTDFLLYPLLHFHVGALRSSLRRTFLTSMTLYCSPRTSPEGPASCCSPPYSLALHTMMDPLPSQPLTSSHSVSAPSHTAQGGTQSAIRERQSQAWYEAAPA